MAEMGAKQTFENEVLNVRNGSKGNMPDAERCRLDKFKKLLVS
jgi:hypothetical protein